MLYNIEQTCFLFQYVVLKLYFYYIFFADLWNIKNEYFDLFQILLVQRTIIRCYDSKTNENGNVSKGHRCPHILKLDTKLTFHLKCYLDLKVIKIPRCPSTNTVKYLYNVKWLQHFYFMCYAQHKILVTDKWKDRQTRANLYAPHPHLVRKGAISSLHHYTKARHLYN